MATLVEKQQAVISQFNQRHNRVLIHKPACLINNIESKVWLFKTEKTFIDATGEYKHVKKIIWDKDLPNSSNLYSNVNKPFRVFIQRAFAQYINSSMMTSSVSIVNLSPHLMLFVSWLFLNDKKFQLNKYFLTKVSNTDLNYFFRLYTRHGHFGVLRVAQRVIEKISLDSKTSLNGITNFFSIGKKDIDTIIEFFTENELFKDNNLGYQVVNLQAFTAYFNLSTQEAYGIKVSLFLRQFELEIQEQYPNLMVPSRLSTEKPSHKVVLINEVVGKPLSKKYMTRSLKVVEGIIQQYPYFPANIKKPSSYQFSEFSELIDKVATEGKSTPYIPFSTAIFYLKHSISFVIENGDQLLSFYIKLMDVFKQNNWLSTNYCSHRNNFIKENIPASLQCFNISGFGVNPASEGFDKKINHHQRIRVAPTLCDLMYILFGACFVLIGALLPYRINEFELLKHDCLFKKKGGGFFVRKSFLKTGTMNIKTVGDRPIHHLSAKAIMLLGGFRKASIQLAINKRNSKYLLFGLDLNNTSLKASAKGDEFVKQCIRSFADFFEVPVDDLGRRWYVNIHELRKFFIINFFWCFKFGHMDTLRWAAGHNNPEHLTSYLKESIGEELFNKIQGLYISYQMKMFNSNGTSEIKNIHLLYNNVCSAFSVSEVSELDNETLEEWLQIKLHDKSIKLDMYTIGDQEADFNMALRIECSDD